MNRKLIWTLASAGMLAAGAPAFAVTIDFDDITVSEDESYHSVAEQYGSLGIHFQGNLVALPNTAGLVENVPTPPNVLTTIKLPPAPLNPGNVMTVDNGFTGALSFDYSNNVQNNFITIWQNANLTGQSLVVSMNVTDADAPDCSGGTPYCFFVSTGTINVGFVAHAIDFGNLDRGEFTGAAIDNLDVNVVPLPAAAWLLMSGMGAVGAIARRRKQLKA